MLEMHGISKIYRTDLIETHALRDFSLKVGDGEFVAVTGPSGSGKTTFLNIAGLLETFDTGTYKLDGEDVSRLSDDARSQLRNEKIGFIFQSFNLIPDLDIFDNVDVPLRYRGIAKKRPRAAHQRARSKSSACPRACTTCPSQLSGGQQQRVAIARALAGEPALPARRRADRQPGLADGAPGAWTCSSRSTRWARPSSWSRTTRSSRAARTATCTSSTARSPTLSRTNRGRSSPWIAPRVAMSLA